MYALIDDRPLPVDSLKSLVAGPGGRVLIAGAATSDEDCRQVRNTFSPLKKKDVVQFNVVTSDWRAITGQAKITDFTVARSDTGLHFYLAMKIAKNRRQGRRE